MQVLVDPNWSKTSACTIILQQNYHTCQFNKFSNSLNQHLLFFEKSPKGDTAQFFWRKSPFFLKSIRQIAPLFKVRVATSMPTGYTVNAPGEKYLRLGEI
jgi:hypothetical protein